MSPSPHSISPVEPVPVPSSQDSPTRRLPSLKPLDPAPAGRAASVRRFAWKLLWAAGIAVALIAVARLLLKTREDAPEEITAAVTRANLPITVTERGEIESSKTADAHCEVEGHQNKIVELVPEGTRVSKDQVIVRFDTAEPAQKLAEQVIKVRQAEAKAETAKQELEVAKNKAASEVAKADLDLTLAVLDRDKYIEGEYQVEEDDLKGMIALQEATLQDDESVAEYYRKLVKKGFRTPEQLRAKEQNVERSRFYLNRDKAKLKVLQKHKKERQVKELTAKAEEAGRNLKRTESSGSASVTKAATDHDVALETARLERNQQERLQKELAKAEVKAPQDGILVFPHERYWDESYRIKLGAMIHFQQKLFSIPDLNQMQVKVKVHEAMVKKVKAGQKVEIRIDAYPNARLTGTVEKVGTLADSRYWDERGVKEYETIVKIDELPDIEIKPGMTAEAKILVGELDDVLLVPVQAVAESEGQHYGYVVGPDGTRRRPVTIGENNDKFVQITDGVSEGEAVALDARKRLAAELKSSEKNGRDKPKEKPDKPTSVAISRPP